MIFRKAQLLDLPMLTDIYNEAVAAGQTADTRPLSVADRKNWFESHQHPLYPLFVLTSDELEEVLGYGTLSPYREGRPALQGVVEVSYYLKKSAQGQGLGRQLLNYLLVQAVRLGFQHAYALLLDNNKRSVQLLKKTGFEQWGHLPGIALVNNKVCGQYIFGKKLEL